jgi:voltage-gated potassium channel
VSGPPGRPNPRRARRPAIARGRREQDPWRRFEFGLLLLASVLAVGTIGYVILGLSPFDGLYQTAITITTVGYGEIAPAGEVDRAYRIFTLSLVLLGASSVIYTVSVLLETVVEGSLNDSLRRRRMKREIDHMRDHVVVAGAGRVGEAIVRYVTRMGRPVVVVDRSPAVESLLVPALVGEATEDQVLLDAGLERASTLIAALDSDADNLYVTITAKAIRPDLFVVARTSSQANEAKFLRAGANRVVNPHQIGGSRMGALAMQPHVAEFLDEVVQDEAHDVAIHEIDVGPDSPAIGSTLSELGAAQGGALVIAIRTSRSTYTTNPAGDVAVGAGDVLIALGSADQLERLERRFARRPPIRFRGGEA